MAVMARTPLRGNRPARRPTGRDWNPPQARVQARAGMPCRGTGAILGHPGHSWRGSVLALGRAADGFVDLGDGALDGRVVQIVDKIIPGTRLDGRGEHPFAD